MADIIQLLPDAIANQIAAGEVVQRPASAVKELMENAIDAGATKVQLIVKDAGSALLQVIDNGFGMSETDARMSFERHATSKIRQAEDLFAIRTMGFRGEALASIAAVAQVELKTRKGNEEVGTKILIEGSEIKSQEAEQCPIGTSIAVKNLFYNIPARRNFLKSNAIEMRHIIEEFERIALANPDIHFTLHSNNTELYHLTSGNLKQRIIGVFGQNYAKNLVPIQEETDVVSYTGFVGRPEFAKKTRGEQLFFINNRFVKNPYLHHAVMAAYEELLTKEAYPFYVIMIDIDPARIDVNVHPTKTEIKFDDEKVVYNYLKVAVRHALGQYSVTPTLDFDSDVSFLQATPRQTNNDNYSETIRSKSSESTFYNETAIEKSAANSINFQRPDRLEASNLRNWESLYKGLDDEFSDENSETAQTFGSKANDDTNDENINTFDDGETLTFGSDFDETSIDGSKKIFSIVQKEPYQSHNTFIISQVKSGIMLIDQQLAHERILYERYLSKFDASETNVQTELFPKTVTLSVADAELLKAFLPEVNILGFDIQEFGQNTFVIHAKPAELKDAPEKEILDTLLDQYKNNLDLDLDIQDNVARSMARSAATKRGKALTVSEMNEIIDQLFACNMPYKSPNGQNCFIIYELDEIFAKF